MTLLLAYPFLGDIYILSSRSMQQLKHEQQKDVESERVVDKSRLSIRSSGATSDLELACRLRKSVTHSSLVGNAAIALVAIWDEGPFAGQPHPAEYGVQQEVPGPTRSPMKLRLRRSIKPVNRSPYYYSHVFRGDSYSVKRRENEVCGVNNCDLIRMKGTASLLHPA